jgi:hypothetical protein
MTGFVIASALLFPLAVIPAAEHEYIGSKKCKVCHLKEYKSWETTAMATSFEDLKPGQKAEAKKAAGLDPEKDYTGDAKCVACHVTGYGKPGGFVDLATTPDLVGVGCEACHGPGGSYTKEGYMTLKNKEYKKAELVGLGMVDTIGENQCKGCHNANSPFVGPDFVFDFSASKEKGMHEVFPLKYPH